MVLKAAWERSADERKGFSSAGSERGSTAAEPAALAFGAAARARIQLRAPIATPDARSRFVGELIRLPAPAAPYCLGAPAARRASVQRAVNRLLDEEN